MLSSTLDQRIATDLKYGKYYIPSSDYSLQKPYSRGKRHTCASEIESWLYEMFKELTPSSLGGANTNNYEFEQCKTTNIPWVQIINMVGSYQNHDGECQSFDSVVDLVNVFVENTTDTILELSGKCLYFPANTRFVISDKRYFHQIVKDVYSLILIDPPWPNRSVLRGKKYSCLDVYSLYDLKLDQRLVEGGLVAIWVSNNPKIQKFIKEKYFKSLHIVLLEEWYWIKVTVNGELVVPFSQEHHRKPFEVLYIGKFTKYKTQDSNSIKRKVMIGVPSKHHSRKPFIHDLLSSHPERPPGLNLECFARNLYPGWTSWGNETLMFNDCDYLDMHKAQV